MKMTNLIIITFLLFFNFRCENFVDHWYFIKVENKSDKTIQCYTSYNYPDTTISGNKPLLQTIEPKAFTKFVSKKDWQYVLPKDTILIYVLNKDTVNTYNWEVIRAKNKILKRYSLSLHDLEKQNWTVIFP